MLERQIFGYLPAFGSSENQTDLDTFFLSHPHFLMYFVAHLFAGRPCFCLKSSVNLTVGLAISGAMSITGEVIIGLLG